MYKDDPSFTEGNFYAWAQGLMSGVNTMLIERHDVPINLALWDIEKQQRHIRDFCAANPLQEYIIAVFDLFDAMRKEQGLPNWTH